MKNYFKKKFTGTGHVLGSGDPDNEGVRPVPLIDKIEAKKEKKPQKTSLTDHLRQMDAERKNAPLQFCEEIPEETGPTATVPEQGNPSPTELLSEEADEEGMELYISTLLSLDEGKEKSIPLLRRVLRNIIANPIDEKFQKLKLSNPKVKEGLVSINGAVDFLCSCGFVQKDDQLVYEGHSSMKLPKTGLSLLNKYSPEIRQPPNPEVPKTEVPVDDDSEVPRRERNTQVLLLKPTEVDLPDWFFDRTSADVKAEYLAAKKKKEIDETFMTRVQRERLKGTDQKKTYTFAVIRVRMPEGILLQGEFDGGESVFRIREWILEQLRDQLRPFEICLPSRKKLGMSGTIKKHEMMPATLLSFTWSDGLDLTVREPSVKDELISNAVLDWTQQV